MNVAADLPGPELSPNPARPRAPGLYIHVPFCRTKCPYCDFFSIPSPALIPRWKEALLKEIQFYKDAFPGVDTLYLGGGTPSFLPDQVLSQIVKAARDAFDLASSPEITIEVNPSDVTPEKASLFQDLGIGRISLGVQSLNDLELALLGRRHTAQEVLGAVKLLRRQGVDNLGLDFLYGIPGQDLKQWRETLKKALALEPQHLSCYQLHLAPGTPFGARRERGELRAPSEEEAGAFFLTTASLLEKAGYLHYEVSNYARSPLWISRHNSKYWERIPYLGLGPSAHSFDGHTRWWNVRRIRLYCDLLKEGRPPVEDRENLSRKQAALETLSLGLRTWKGVALDTLPSPDSLGSLIERLFAERLIRMEGRRICPTRKGLVKADGLARAFAEWL